MELPKPELPYHYDGYYHNMVPNPFLIKVVDRINVGRALDLGCGNGRNASYIKNKGWEVICCDIDEKAIKLCIQAGLDAWQIDILDEKVFEKNSFDLIICLYVYQHLTSRQQLIITKRIWDNLSSNGWFLWGTFLDERLLLPPEIIFPNAISKVVYRHTWEKLDQTHCKAHKHKGIVIGAQKVESKNYEF